MITHEFYIQRRNNWPLINMPLAPITGESVVTEPDGCKTFEKEKQKDC